MSDTIKCEILKTYGEFADGETESLKVCEVKWNNRKPKGYDIRKYDKESDTLRKGITIPYNSVDDLVYILLSNGLCNLDKASEAIDKMKNSIYSQKDFSDMFESTKNDIYNYKRNKYGELIDDDKNVIIKKTKNDRS